MANQEHLEIFNQGVAVWNSWREANPGIENIDLSNLIISEHDNPRNLRRINLSGVNLTNSHMFSARLDESNLSNANLSGCEFWLAQFYGVKCVNADFTGADLREVNANDSNFTGSNLCNVSANDAYFTRAIFRNAVLSDGDLRQSNLNQADFTNAILHNANLEMASCVQTNFENAILTGARLVGGSFVQTNFNRANLNNAFIYGISVWDVTNENLQQENLIIHKEPMVTVDDIEIAQFIYLLLNNNNIRKVLGTVAKKGVLILGRFSPERKKILDAIRDKLRELDFLPMMFDFEKVSSKDFTETIKILAGMSRFVIADISNPSSSPLELQATLPDYKIPFVPIIEAGQYPFAMFQDLTIYPWCLDVIEYDSEDRLIKNFQKGIIDRAINKEQELLDTKGQSKKPIRNIDDL